MFLGDPDHGVTPVRIFTPGSELPFAGHPLVGATWHVAEPGATVSLECGIGVVTGRRADHDRASIDVEYLAPVDVAGTAAAWIAKMPLPYEVRRLASPDDVASYEPPDEPDHRLVWAPGEDCRDDMVRARFFAFGVGVPEDPATGSAAVALAAVQRYEGRSSGSFTIHQGSEMGCPSRIDLTWAAELTTIGGTVIDDGTRSVAR